MKLDSIIVRFGGEIGIKSEGTRRAFEKLLSRNIRRILEHHDVQYQELIEKRGRIYLRTTNIQGVIRKLTQVFGISSVSPASRTSSDMNDTVQRAFELARDMLKRGSRFAVHCHRVGKHPYSSMNICEEVGDKILADLSNQNLKVDLENPQFTINVEVREEEAYIFSEKIQGTDGFPLGSQEKVVCLLSGGIDSPVACWLAMKRGCPIVPIHFDIASFTDERTVTKALDVARRLFEWSIGFPRRVYIVPHGKNLETFIEEGPSSLTCILCKRMMYRIAERIAEKEKVEGIITGEAIGEQASQTLHNLRVLDEAATQYPVHRPLLGFNKLETEKLAKRISTFEVSTRRSRGCTAAPKKPTTKAKLEVVREAEQALNIEEMISDSIQRAKIIRV